MFGINGEAENNYGVVVSVTGSASISATGSLGYEERTIVAKSRFNVGEMHVTGKVSVEAGGAIGLQFATIDRVVFEGKSLPENGEPHKYVLYSW